MKIPLEWLAEYVPNKLPAEALAERLTMAGLEVTGIERVEGEPVLELEITPNRADCLSILGVAREVATAVGQPLKVPAGARRAVGATHAPSPRAGPPRLVVRVEDREGCVRYTGRLIDNVRIGPAPAWMQRRLSACGVRPINNVVDVTNYVLLESGQPLHAFDFDRLQRGMIVVRRAHPKEPLKTLDGQLRELTPDALVIADGQRAVAVAGVMGGEEAAVTSQTRTVLLESALFNPIAVRRTARRLGLATESSYRFERGVDPTGVEDASARAAALICELAAGREIERSDVGSKPLKRVGIVLDAQRASRWLGLPLSPSAVRTTLARVSCQVASSATATSLHVSIPTFRQDLRQDVDLTEELARVIGYARVPSTIPQAAMVSASTGSSTPHERLYALKLLCAGLGFQEVITWSLLGAIDLERCGGDPAQATRLANPLSQDHAYLRPSLVMGLLQAVRRNLTQGAEGVRLFEAGYVMTGGTEQLQLGLALAGLWTRDWQGSEAADFFRLKGAVHALLGRLCGGTLEVSPQAVDWAEPGQSATLRCGGRRLGVAGQVATASAKAIDLEHEVWIAELAVPELLSLVSSPAVKPPAPFPPVKRDLSFLVADGVPFQSIEEVIRDLGGPLASRIELIDRYTGVQVPKGTHSLTVSIDYRDPSRTLTADEVDALHARIGQGLVRRFQAALR